VAHIKPIKVQTSDRRHHEVDIRQLDKSFTAWGFVDKVMIQGAPAATQHKALSNWKKEYDTAQIKAT
jgi:hypothetical protein